MDWNKVSVDGEQPKPDLLRVEMKVDHIIRMLNAIHDEMNPSSGTGLGNSF